MFASLGSHVASGYRIRRPRQNRGTLAVGDGCQEVWATVLRQWFIAVHYCFRWFHLAVKAQWCNGRSDRFLDRGILRTDMAQA